MSLDIVTEKLRYDTSIVLHWFSLNSMVANPEKFQIMFLGIKDNTNLTFEINGFNISATNTVKLLGITIDHKLSFSLHVEAICKQASQKTNALLRIRKYLSLDKASLLFKAYVFSNFFYCPLIWMFCSKASHNLINKVHRRALCALYFRFDLDLPELLKLDGSLTIHTKHLQTLMTEVFKCLNKLNPEFMWGYFVHKETPYTLRSLNTVKLPPTKTRSFGLNTFKFRASILWNTLPRYLKLCSGLNEFKLKIKSWEGSDCSCSFCRKF